MRSFVLYPSHGLRASLSILFDAGLPGDRAGYTGQRFRGSGGMCANDGIDTLSFQFLCCGRLRVAILFEYMLITGGILVSYVNDR